MRLPLLLLLLLLCLPSFGASRDDGADLDGARDILQKWVETRRLISRERHDWAIGREMLNDRIELVQSEIGNLRTRIDETAAGIAETDVRYDELAARNEALERTAEALHETVVALEARTRALLVRLPDPIRERVKPLSQGIPEDPDATRPGLGARYLNVVGILKEVEKFNQQITVTSEVRALPDGSSVEVAAIYLGIGQGFYASVNGSVAGTGSVTADGWTWTPANELAPRVTEAIAILRNEKAAAFVQLPVRID